MLAATSRTTRFGVSFCSFIFPSFQFEIPGLRGSSMNYRIEESAHLRCARISSIHAPARKNVGRNPHCEWLCQAAERGSREVRRKDTTRPSAAQIPALPSLATSFQPIVRLWPEMCSNGPPPVVGKFRSLGPGNSRLSAVSDEAPGPSNDGVVAVPKVHR